MILFKQFRRNIQEELKNIPDFLYHATYEPLLKDIQRFGLGVTKRKNYSDSREGVIYFADDPYVANSYAETSDDVPEEWLDQIVMLKIETSNLDKSKLEVDQNNLSGDTYEYHGVVKPNSIEVIDVPDLK